MKRTVFLTLCIGAWTVALTGATPAPTTAPAGGAEDAAVLRREGIRRAMEGQFEAGLELLKQASRTSPNDTAATTGRRLLEGYLRDRAASDAHRREEYAEAAARVRQCLLAHRSFADLESGGLLEGLRKKSREAFEAYNQAVVKMESAHAEEREAFELRLLAQSSRRRADDLRADARAARGEGTDEGESRAAALDKDADALIEEAGRAEAKAEDMASRSARDKEESLEALETTRSALNEAVESLRGRTDAYAETFRRLSAAAQEKLRDCREFWQRAKATAAADYERQASDLKNLEDAVGEALADVDSLVDKESWRIALGQARLARTLARPEDRPAQQDWYVDLVRDVQQRGAKAVAEARWYEALNAYAGLEDLEEDNLAYAEQAKVVRRHVRVLGLYSDRESSPSSQPVEEGQTTWKDLVAGVDAEMVKSAISQLGMFYVSTVDYQRLIRGAIAAVRVLAETPQVAATFPALKDAQEKQRFLQAIAHQLENAEKRDRVDHVDLLLALNGVLRASEQTVRIPAEVLAVEFTDGLLAELDKFSAMIWPHDMTDFSKNTMGHFYGVGIQITKERGEPLKVVTPLADSPALKAGVRTGDSIIAVDGTPTPSLSLDKLIGMIMGEKGTKVVLTIERPGRPTPFHVEIVRDRIDIKTVKGWRREPGGKWHYLLDDDGGIGYLRLTQFTEKTHGEVLEALEELRKELNGRPLRSLVLDLRFNPGGLLRSATDVADEFLPDGRIVTTRGRQKQESEVTADAGGNYLKGDLVVLVNEQSASAAEIVSGALKDLFRAVIVGERTFGKGSVQNVIPIRQRRALLKLTTAYYYLPSGRLLHRENGQKEWGVDPDIKVTTTPRQVKRWLDIRRRTELLHADEVPAWLEEDLSRQFEEDIQLRTAVLLLRLGQLRDDAPAALTASAERRPA